MNKIPYTITIKSGLHTGADEKAGTFTPVRKKAIQIPTREVTSKFASRTEQRRAFMTFLLEVYKQIDSKLKRKYYGYYEALKGHLLTAAEQPTKWQFLDALLTRCGIEMLYNNDVVQIINQFTDLEISLFVKSEIQLILMMLRYNVKGNREKYKQIEVLEHSIKFITAPEEEKLTMMDAKKKIDLEIAPLDELKKRLATIRFEIDVLVEDEEKPIFREEIVNVPYVSANSIAGLMRDLLTLDYFEQIGLIESEKQIPHHLYHQMFTGGTITESTAYANFAARETFVRICPVIGLLGTAAGNQTLESTLAVSNLELQCVENGTGHLASAALLENEFGTRVDDQKQEMTIRINGKGKGKTAQQMRYYHETIIAGAKMDGNFRCTSFNPIVQSCFKRGLNLLKAHGILGGKGNRGYGRVEFSYPVQGDSLYLSHLKEIREEALNYFTTKEVAT